MNKKTKTTKNVNEIALNAFFYIFNQQEDDLMEYCTFFGNKMKLGDKLAENCYNTLMKIFNREGVEDIEVLGLAFILQEMENNGQMRANSFRDKAIIN